MAHAFSPVPDVLQAVRASFVAKGETLAGWCRANGIDHSWAWRVLRGRHVGPSANALRERIVADAFKALDRAA